MKIVVGLGNPGRQYEGTRHNVGFAVLAELARRHLAPAPKIKFEAEYTEVRIADEKCLLVAPQTYMNLSGRSVQQFVKFFQLPLEDLLVVCDDLNLDVGRLRLRRSGSAGGQKGLNDIIQRLGTQQFARLRIGIGRPLPKMDAADYVLSRFRSNEAQPVEDAILAAADGVESWVERGLESTMNRMNAPVAGRPEKSDEQ
jgi:peptidyl-tRNA hydrolase, PTH1 family